MKSLVQRLKNIFPALKQRPQPRLQRFPRKGAAVSHVEGVHIYCTRKIVASDAPVPLVLRLLLNYNGDEIRPGQHYYHITVTFADVRPTENYYVAPSNNRSGVYSIGGMGALIGVRSTKFDGVSVDIPPEKEEPWLYLHFSRKDGSSTHGHPLSRRRRCSTAT